MYSPTTRALTVLELLQSRNHMSGSEIARRLEVDPRTVRRYIAMLQDMGIPIEAERGASGAYYLQRGFKLPPLMFTDAEAVALTLGLMAIRELRFPVDVAAIEGALAKTERVMPEGLLNQARALQEAISFKYVMPRVTPENDTVVTLSTAIQERLQVRLRYRAWNGEDTERVFNAYGIVFYDGFWFTAGYCHLRGDLRTFRMDRIADLTIIEGYFERPENFDTMEYVINSITTMPGSAQAEILLKTTLEKAQIIQDNLMGTLEETDEGIIFRRAAYPTDWIAHVLLSADYPVIIRQPQELRETLRQFAERALQMAGIYETHTPF